MAHKQLIVALGMIVAISPVLASSPEPTTAPDGTAETRYCLRVEPATGTRLDTVQCWTREQWVALGVDLDQEWPKEGVKTVG